MTRCERAMHRFRSSMTLQKFSSIHAQVHNQFNQERHLVTRQVYKQRHSAALAGSGEPWRRRSPLAKWWSPRISTSLCHFGTARLAPIVTSAAEMIDGDGKQEHDAAGCVLIKDRHVHEAHAVVEASHQQRSEESAENPAATAGQRGTANDRRSDRVELKEQSRRAADRAADARRERDAGHPIAEAGDDEVPENRPASH